MNPIEPRRGRSRRDVATVPRQDGNKIVVLESRDEPRLRGLERKVVGRRPRGRRTFGNRLVDAERENRRDDVLQLAHVAWPGPTRESIELGLVDRMDDAVFQRPLAQKFPHQDGDVLEPLAERREAHDHTREGIVKVLPERAAIGFAEQVSARCGNHPHVDEPLAGPAEGRDHVVLEKAQEAALEVEPEIAHLVDEERPPVGSDERAHLGLDRRRFSLPEELDREGGIAARSAVDEQERTMAARARSMNGLAREPLAGSALASEQERRIALGDPREPLEHRAHERALSDEATETRSLEFVVTRQLLKIELDAADDEPRDGRKVGDSHPQARHAGARLRAEVVQHVARRARDDLAVRLRDRRVVEAKVGRSAAADHDTLGLRYDFWPRQRSVNDTKPEAESDASGVRHGRIRAATSGSCYCEWLGRAKWSHRETRGASRKFYTLLARTSSTRECERTDSNRIIKKRSIRDSWRSPSLFVTETLRPDPMTIDRCYRSG